MKTASLILFSLCLSVFSVANLFAQTASQEPGQAESRDRDRAVDDVQWTQPAREARGVWFASRDMLESREQILAKLDALQQAGYNIVLLDSWFRGYAGFEGSDVAPRYPQFKDDVFGFIIEESIKRGMAVHSWPEYGFYAYHTQDPKNDPSAGPILDRHPELMARSSSGEKYLFNPEFGGFYSMCPSNPKSHELLGRVITDSVKLYPALTGVNLDRIRYPEHNYCHCDYCKTHFQRDTGIALGEFAEGSTEAKRWLDWRREQTAVAVETITKMIRAERPGIPITAYVVGPFEMDSKAQGWDLWAKRGLLDGVAVSMYGADITRAADRALELLGEHKHLLICAISSSQRPEIFASNIEIARRYSKLGQFTWYAGTIPDKVDTLKAGPHQKPAETTLPTK